MPSTFENWLGFVNSCVYSAYQTYEIYQILPYSVDCKAPGELSILLSKTLLSKYTIIWNKGPVNFWNNRKGQK